MFLIFHNINDSTAKIQNIFQSMPQNKKVFKLKFSQKELIIKL